MQRVKNCCPCRPRQRAFKASSRRPGGRRGMSSRRRTLRQTASAPGSFNWRRSSEPRMKGAPSLRPRSSNSALRSLIRTTKQNSTLTRQKSCRMRTCCLNWGTRTHPHPLKVGNPLGAPLPSKNSGLKLRPGRRSARSSSRTRSSTQRSWRP